MAKTRRFGKAEVEVSIRDRVGQGLKAIERRMTSFGAGLQSVGSRISVIGASTTAAFAGLGAALAFPTKLAAGLEQTTVAFETLLGSADRAQALLKQLRSFAASTPLSFDDIATAARNLIAFGFAAEDVETELRRVGDIASGIGQPIGEIAEIYGKARVQGRLFGEDVNQLTGRGIPVIQEFAKQLGVAESQVKQMVAEGKIGFPNLQLAFASLAGEGGKFGGMMEKQSKTLTGLISTLRDNVFNALIPIGQAVSDIIKPIVTQMIALVEPVSRWIQANAGFIKGLVVAVAAGTAAGAVLTALGGAIVVAGVAVASITALFGAVGSIIAVIASPIGILAGSLAALTMLTLHATDGFSRLGEMFAMLGETATSAWGGIVAAIESGDLKTAGEIAFTALEVAWLTLTTKMKGLWAQVADYFQNIWLDVIKWIIQAGSNIYFSLAKTFDQLGNALAAGFDIGFVYIKGAIDQIITSIAKAIVEAQRFFGILNSDTAEGAKQSLDQDLAARAAGRQAGLDSRAASRGAGLEERDAARRATQKSFLDAVTEDLNRRRASTTVDKSALDAANERLAALQGLSESAKAAALGGGLAKPDQLANALQAFQQVGRQNKSIKAIGTSSAAAVAAGAFGVRSNAANETAQNTRKTAQLLQKVLLRPNGFV